MINLIFSQMKPDEQKIRLQVVDRFFLVSTLSFRNFKWNFDSFSGFTKILESYVIASLIKKAESFVIGIKWTYLELSVDR